MKHLWVTKQISIKYTGSTEYAAEASYVLGFTIKIGKPLDGPIYKGLFSNPYDAEETSSMLDGPEATLLHEVVHLCGEKDDLKADAISHYYFPSFRVTNP